MGEILAIIVFSDKILGFKVFPVKMLAIKVFSDKILAIKQDWRHLGCHYNGVWEGKTTASSGVNCQTKKKLTFSNF